MRNHSAILPIALLALLLALPGTVRAATVTPEQLMGEYTLVSFTISDSTGTYPSSIFTTFRGRASATTKGLVMDMYGRHATIGSIYYYSCGFYSLWSSSDKMTVAVEGQPSKTVTFSLSNDRLTTSWTENVDGFNTSISCVWRKTQSYYATQAGGTTKVVVIPLD